VGRIYLDPPSTAARDYSVLSRARRHPLRSQIMAFEDTWMDMDAERAYEEIVSARSVQRCHAAFPQPSFDTPT